MWCYRRVQKISWTDRVTNEKFQKEYHRGKVHRKNEMNECHIVIRGRFLRLILEGMVYGKNYRARLRLQYMSQNIGDQ